MHPFKISVSWKSLPGLPPCTSGLFRKRLDIVGEILRLPFALGGPVAKAYSSHLGCLHTHWGKTGSLGGPCLGHPRQDGVTHPQHSAHISPRAEEGVALPSDVTCSRSPRPRWLAHSPLSSNLDKNHREKMKHGCPRKHVSPSSVGWGRVGSGQRLSTCALSSYTSQITRYWRHEVRLRGSFLLSCSSLLFLHWFFPPCKSPATEFSDLLFSFLHLHLVF